MTRSYKNFLFYWFPIIIYCLIIFIQSSYPSPETTPDLPHFDKLLHFFAYAVLGALFLRAFKTTQFKNNINIVIILSILASSFYGISDELHQYFVPFRNADIMDALADTIGSICGVYLFQKFRNSKT
ncbi:MAG: VanZ family protein [Deltaproteobacteria bacterium]|nr:VanZ family protein [Deltaproteobacteria bacterium]MBW2661358.1 VanZ family protein [Deltaproteobacteria bacterium]